MLARGKHPSELFPRRRDPYGCDELFWRMFTYSEFSRPMVSERHETRSVLSVLGLLRVKVSGFGNGNDSIGDGYAEDLQLQTSWNAPSPRPDCCLWRDVNEVYAHALYLQLYRWVD
jgi:hypothetical protein